MQSTSKFTNILPRLLSSALTSVFDFQLSAALIKGQKMITPPCNNTSRNFCRGQSCGSIHAEAHAILTHFGNSLKYDIKNGWCLLQRKKGKGFFK